MVSTISYFHPYSGKIPILTNIFRLGRNHQLDEKELLNFHPVLCVFSDFSTVAFTFFAFMFVCFAWLNLYRPYPSRPAILRLFFALRNVSKSTPKQLGATRKFEGFAQSLWFQRKSAETVHVGKKISRVENTFGLGFVCLVIFVLSLPWQITIEPPFGAYVFSNHLKQI